MKHYSAYDTARFSESCRSLSPVFEATTSVVQSPKRLGQQANRRKTNLPSLHPKVISDVIINCASSAFRQDSKVLLPDHAFGNERIDIAERQLLYWHSVDRAIIRNHDVAEIDKGICVFGSAAQNWYHWMLEILPAASLATKLKGEWSFAPLLVPEHCAVSKPFYDSLKAVAPNKEILFLKRQTNYQIGSLLVFDCASVSPLNLVRSEWLRLSDYKQNLAALAFHRDRVLKDLKIKTRLPQRKIFLSRHGRDRKYNQLEVEDTLRDYNFEVVYPETLTFLEQVQMFRDARIIVGPSGAAFTGILFSQSTARALSWVPEEYQEFCSFSNIAELNNFNMTYIFVKTKKPVSCTADITKAEYSLDTTVLRRNLEVLLA